jgi:site-specific recombinase XerD
MTPANKGQKLPPEPLTANEINALLHTCSNRAPTGIRNKALIVVLWRAGLRCQESLSILPKDLDHTQGTIRVLMGKGKRSRLVGLDPQAWAVLQRWLDRRHELGINGRSPVFCTLTGKPLSHQYVRNLLPRLARKANIEKRVHAHGLRHTHAFELANEAVPIHVIQQQLGHTSLATTDRYIRHLNPQKVVETMQARGWNA